ncbi:MAG: phage holin family protein [Betaproteobacteria bacterium]|nr:phage holin family protein [Betaproteobacteria bacterium]
MQPDTSGVTHAAGTEGFLLHLRQLGASVLQHAAMRVELLSIEVQEEKLRLVRLAMSAALVSALMIISLVMLAILILAIYWDTPNRVPAALWLAGTFGVLTVGGGFYVAAQLQYTSTLFVTSASELRSDARALVSPPPAPLP